MSINEEKILLGGMDRENSVETISVYDYIEAHNIRTVGLDESDANYTSNLEGTKLITINIPMGQNRGIGAKRFETISKAYIVRYNSMGYHQIVEFDFDTMVETVVFENLTESASVDLLNWTPQTFFSDIRIVHDKFLILNNGVNEIYCINIEKFKKKGFLVKETDLYLIKQPPLKPIELRYVNNTRKTTNTMRGNLPQFRSQNVYEDLRQSSWSTISKRPVPINEQANGQGQSVSYANGILVSTKVDIDSISSVNIAFRIGNGTWLLAREVSKEHLLKLGSNPLTNTPILVGSTGNLTNPDIEESFDPITNTYQFIFYNDGLYPVIIDAEALNPYDAIPYKAETVEVVNGNVVAIGGFTEGRDRPEVEGIEISTSQYAPNLSNTVIGGTDFDFSHRQDISVFEKRFYFKGTPKEGDVAYMKYKMKTSPAWKIMSYTVNSTDQLAGLNATVTSIYGVFKNADTGLPLITGKQDNYLYTSIPNLTEVYDVEMYVVRKDIGLLSTQSINTLKTNSSYQLALEYVDKYGRYFPIVTDERFIVDTSSITETQGNLPQINWTIEENAPEGAVSYQWLISENQKYLNSIYLTGKIDTTETNENYVGIELKSLERFLQNEKESQINYSFTKGDKVVFMYTTNGNNNTIVDWFRYPFIELDIVDFQIKSDPSTPEDIKYILKVRRTDLLNKSGDITWLNGKDIMLELYTPKKRDISTENIMFHEIGQQFDIINGKHSVTSGSIREGDWFYRGRIYESTITPNQPIVYEVEDPNFSDNYRSKYWSAGRTRTYNDEVGRTERKAHIRYSDEYRVGSKYNGLSTFFLERIYGEQGGETTSKYGWIRKLETRDSALVCIQEFKVSVVPVYQSILFDSAGRELLPESGKILGNVQYRTMNYGCGDAKESIVISRNSNIYFFDDNNCVPCRDTFSQGLDVIDKGMSSYFIKYAKEAKNKGAKFIGYFDDINREYNLTIEEVSGRLTSISFNEADVIYKDPYTPTPSEITIVQPQNGNVTSSGYSYTLTPDTDYVGDLSFSVTYINNGVTFTKNVRAESIAGDGTPDPFIFNTKSNQERGAVVESESIVVTGINMPTEITITGGDYRVNNGAWSNSLGSVVNGDIVKVRHTTSTLYDTSTTTALTIGGVNGTFSTITVPENTSTDNFKVTGEVLVDNGAIKVKVDISHELSVNYNISSYVVFENFGLTDLTPDVPVTILAGQTTNTVDTGHVVAQDDNSFIKSGHLKVETSSAPHGSIITTSDSISRVVVITESMKIPLRP